MMKIANCTRARQWAGRQSTSDSDPVETYSTQNKGKPFFKQTKQNKQTKSESNGLLIRMCLIHVMETGLLNLKYNAEIPIISFSVE